MGQRDLPDNLSALPSLLAASDALHERRQAAESEAGDTVTLEREREIRIKIIIKKKFTILCAGWGDCLEL